MTEIFKNCSLVDLAFFIVAAVLVIRGFIRGFSGEVGSLLGILAAVSVVYLGNGYVSSLIRATGWGRGSALLVDVSVFVTMLVLCIASWLLISLLAKKLLKCIFPQPFDSILGGVVGGAKAVAILALLCTLGWLMPVKNWISSVSEGSSVVKSVNQSVRPEPQK